LNAEFGLRVKDQNDGCPGIAARKSLKGLALLRTWDVIVVDKKYLVTAADFEVVIHDNGIGWPGTTAQNELTGTETERRLEFNDILSSGRLLTSAKNVFARRENIAKLHITDRSGSLRSIDKLQNENHTPGQDRETKQFCLSFYEHTQPPFVKVC